MSGGGRTLRLTLTDREAALLDAATARANGRIGGRPYDPDGYALELLRRVLGVREPTPGQGIGPNVAGRSPRADWPDG